MKKFKCKSVMALVLSMILFTGNSVTADAYTTLGLTWSSSTITYYYENYNSNRAKSYFETGASGWSSTDVNFVKGNSANYNIYCTEVYNENVEWDGLTNHNPSWGIHFERQVLQLNYASTRTWNNDKALQSVVIHEFGHCLGLDHTLGKVIMNPYTWGDESRYGAYSIFTIQTDDRNGANALY